ncbi:MAG: DUF2851 family protein [Verrucomicrobia bacterium]|nr:DUF2851 family protein [Verrucomicrobiota bacterium]
MPYAALLQQVRSNGARVADDPPLLPDELELQSLWFAGAFGRDFQTTTGQPVRIVQFGEWNHAAGPDFLHAAVELDGTLLSGPLEIDTHPADWEQHGHATNPAFESVILHVVFEPGRQTHFTRSPGGREIPRAVIPTERLREALNHSVLSRAASHLGRCSHPLSQLPVERVHDLLTEAARFRLQRKTRQLQQLEDSHGLEDALWQSLARALGYGPNKLPMTLLGQRASRRILKNLHTNISRESLLFGLAGFLEPDLHKRAPVESRRYLESLWQHWWKLRAHHEPAPERVLTWALSGSRPPNHAHRRLGALAAVSTEWTSLSRPVQRPTGAALKNLRERLTHLEHPFWTHHYTLGSHKTKRPVALFGAARANEFLGNYYIPRWSLTNPQAAWQAFLKLPGGTPSDPVRRAATRLFGSREDQSSFHKKLWQQQALLQIYSDFCLQDVSDCNDCPFPEQLAQW